MAQRRRKDDETPSAGFWALLAEWMLQRHRKKQEQIAARVERGVVESWQFLHFGDLDGTTPAFLHSALDAVESGFYDSQEATAAFIEDYRELAAHATGVEMPKREPVESVRQAETAAGIAARLRESLATSGRNSESGFDRASVERRLADAFDPVKVAADLASSGPGSVKRSMPTAEDIAMATGMRNAVGAAVRNAMDGGRGVTRSEADEDAVVVGWQRVTDEDPCYFCALLASLGAFYKRRKSFSNRNSKTKQEFAKNKAFDFIGEPSNIAKVHNHCRCTLVPVYEGFEQDDRWGKVALSVWAKVTEDEGLSGNAAMNRYRKLFTKLSDNIDVTDLSDDQVHERIQDALTRLPEDGAVALFLRPMVA